MFRVSSPLPPLPCTSTVQDRYIDKICFGWTVLMTSNSLIEICYRVVHLVIYFIQWQSCSEWTTRYRERKRGKDKRNIVYLMFMVTTIPVLCCRSVSWFLVMFLFFIIFSSIFNCISRTFFLLISFKLYWFGNNGALANDRSHTNKHSLTYIDRVYPKHTHKHIQ